MRLVLNTNVSFLLVAIILVSILLGYNSYKSTMEDEPREGENEKLLRNSSKHRKFKDFWTQTVNYLVGGAIAFYFVRVRWSQLVSGESIVVGDMLIGIVFLLSMFGHLPVLSYNITVGIKAILAKVLE